MLQEQEPNGFKKLPSIGEDMDKLLFPAELPKNPNLVIESFWNPRKQVHETINHQSYRRLSIIAEVVTGAYLGTSITGWISTGKWQVGVGLFLLGILSAKVGTNIAAEYNQKLKDAGYTYIKTCDIE